jgi:DNA mismatch endonuclease (patch repair protein)
MEKQLKKHLRNGRFCNVTKKRSSTMAAIRSKNNKTTELPLKMALVRSGITGWHANITSIKGKPDIYFIRQQLAVFVDGCFWHGCTKCGHIPKTRKSFWAAKIARNIERDRSINNFLEEGGVKVLRFWEHEVNDQKSLMSTITIKEGLSNEVQ